MGRQRREFGPEYKDEAVKLVISTDRTGAVVARELGIQASTLGRWVNLQKDRHDGGEPAAERERTGRAGLGPQGTLMSRGGWVERRCLMPTREAAPPTQPTPGTSPNQRSAGHRNKRRRRGPAAPTGKGQHERAEQRRSKTAELDQAVDLPAA
jgi:hypothetical protein